MRQIGLHVLVIVCVLGAVLTTIGCGGGGARAGRNLLRSADEQVRTVDDLTRLTRTSERALQSPASQSKIVAGLIKLRWASEQLSDEERTLVQEGTCALLDAGVEHASSTGEETTPEWAANDQTIAEWVAWKTAQGGLEVNQVTVRRNLQEINQMLLDKRLTSWEYAEIALMTCDIPDTS
jgi:hypothetical protein